MVYDSEADIRIRHEIRLLEARREMNEQVMRQIEAEAVHAAAMTKRWLELRSDILRACGSFRSQSISRLVQRFFKVDHNALVAANLCQQFSEELLTNDVVLLHPDDLQTIVELFIKHGISQVDISQWSLSIGDFIRRVQGLNAEGRAVRTFPSLDDEHMHCQRLQQSISNTLGERLLAKIDETTEIRELMQLMRMIDTRLLQIERDRIAQRQATDQSKNRIQQAAMSNSFALQKSDDPITELLPYTREIESASQKRLQQLQRQLTDAEHSSDVEELLAKLAALLHVDRPEEKSSDQVLSISLLFEISTGIVGVLQRGVSLGSKTLLVLIDRMLASLLREVRDCGDETIVLFYAMLMPMVLQSLPTNMQSQVSKLLLASLVADNPLCVPKLISCSSTVNGSTNSRVARVSEQDMRVFMFYCALVGRSANAASPVHASDGWLWLVRATQQMALLIDKPADSGDSHIWQLERANLWRMMRIFLKFAGNVLFTRYQGTFEAMLRHQQAALTPIKLSGAESDVELKRLKQLLDEAIKLRVLPPLNFKRQDDFVIEALALARY